MRSEYQEVNKTLQLPLHIACHFGHIDAFKFLLRKEVCTIIIIYTREENKTYKENVYTVMVNNKNEKQNILGTVLVLKYNLLFLATNG